MAIIKCKMCGGDLEITEGVTVAECEYCGTKQTVPSADSEKKTSLFLRANKLRFDCDFDRAANIYDSIITDFPAEPEAYWGLLLCKYGIEYVDDPATGKKVPTCHRSSYESVLEDENLEKVMEYADAVARRVYRDEAKAIEDIRKGILEVSGKEPPYDIFICYKETDESGERTVDSVLAQDVYDALTEKGYRVFFSRITLEDKLGTQYEPYIFAALNSAKIMLVFGTDYEYFNAVWVKNEWSRFLKLMAQDKSKHLIPCYKDVDAYDMPKEFQKLQGQDMGKVGAVQDLLRGIDKLLGKGTAAQAAAPAQAAGGPTVDSLLKRAQMFLEDGNWDSANEYFDKVLDIAPESAEAYVGKFCAERKYHQISEVAEDSDAFSGQVSTLWERALEFATPELYTVLKEYQAASEKITHRKAQQENAARQETEKRLAAIRPYAQGLLAASEAYVTVGLGSDGRVAAVGPNTYGQCNVSYWKDIIAVCTGGRHTVGLRADGTVVAVGKDGQCRVSDWRDIVAICAGNDHTIGLRSDGTVVAVGTSLRDQCNVSGWKNIVAICAGDEHTVGLRGDGTVVAVGNNNCGQCNVSSWKDITAICARDSHTIGLRADGTVVAVGSNVPGSYNVPAWTDIVMVCTGNSHTVGLKADGTVVAAGNNHCGQCNVSDWKNIVAICAGGFHTIGLQADGKVVVAGNNSQGECNVSDWCNIVAICAGGFHTIGLQADGKVVAVGSNSYGECNVSDWQLFSSVETLKAERTALRQRREEARQKDEQHRKEKQRWEEEQRRHEEERRRREEEQRTQHRNALEDERTRLQAELPTIKGLFSGGKRRQVEARLAEIEAELKKL
ncbi:TIR domain-containing protein [Pseudoflavonifractor capillosus]|uniref:TIR domain-containing protein n=1 Tax=Pseudoflavonifractor capillosus TaxID=106588 RepID=UPI001956E6E3|nr:TIR domain-containing protein [Pseudoflavonifractor capillosus]MBM6679763.1 TIR domain-containing protein [Pseudoflavonifractor capillosus]